MLRVAASWRVKSVAKLAGSRTYSSCDLVAQRSVVAALLIRTSANIDFPLFLNIAQRSGSGAIERGFFAKNGGLKQAGLSVIALPAFACSDGLVLHDG